MIITPHVETRTEWITYILHDGRWSWVGITSCQDAETTAANIQGVSPHRRAVKVERRVTTIVTDVAVLLTA